MLTYQASSSDLPTILLSYILYAVIILVYGGWLRHLFGKRAQRFGWLLLAGQLLLLTMHGWPIGPHAWWNHDAEYNIPVAFSTFQVLAGSFCALAITALAPLRPRWLRSYWALLALGLYVLGQDEFGVLHDRFPILEEIYLLGGVITALLTVAVWRYLDPKKRRFLYLIILGLVVSVIGAEVFDKMGTVCRDYLKQFSMYCVRFHPLEESLEKTGAFFVVIATLGFAETTVAALRWQRIRRPMLLVFIVFTFLLLGNIRTIQARLDLSQPSTSVSLRFRYLTEFENDYVLLGSYFRKAKVIENGHYYLIYLYGEADRVFGSDFGYAIHIVDQANESVYAAHEHWSRRTAEDWLRGRVYRDYQQLWVPEDVPTNRALWFVLSIWQETEDSAFTTIPIRASEDHLLSETQIVLREFVIPAEPDVAKPENALDFRFSNGIVLRGVENPDSAHLGETLTIPMTWEAATDGDEDWTQFLHFVHEETWRALESRSTATGCAPANAAVVRGPTGHRNLANHHTRGFSTRSLCRIHGPLPPE